MENTILYNDKSDVTEEDYIIPLGFAEKKREGTDLTIVAHGRATVTSLVAAEQLKRDHGIETEVVDLRSIRPLDEATILESVRKTNRILLVEENKLFSGVDAQISHMVQEKAFDYLDGPIKRLSAVDASLLFRLWACFLSPGFWDN